MPSNYQVTLLDVNVSGDRFASTFPTLLKHLLSGKVRTVRGGTKQRSELRKCIKLVRLFNLLNDSKFLINADDQEVDNAVKSLEDLINKQNAKCQRDCDDPHFFALAKIKSISTIASKDSRIASCRRLLNQSNVSRDFYRPLIVMQSDDQYINRYKRKSL